MATLFIALVAVVGLLALISLLNGKDRKDGEQGGFTFSEQNVIDAVKRILEARMWTDCYTGRSKGREIIRQETAAARLRDAVMNACLGDSARKTFLKETIKDVLLCELGVTPENISEIIPFYAPDLMTAADKFGYLYALYSREYMFKVFSRMALDFGWKSDEVREIDSQMMDEAYDRCRISSDFTDLLEVVAQRCYEKLYGHDCADILITDDSVDGVSGGTGGITRSEYNYLREMEGVGRTAESRSYDTVYCVFMGRLIRMRFLSFGSEEALKRVVKNIYRFNSGKVLSRKDPVVLGTFADNSRVMAARPPVVDGWTFFLRKFNNTIAADLDSLLVHENSGAVIELLKAIVGSEFNFVVSGNTGGGKTTLVKALVKYINPGYTIRVAEASFELNLNNLYPERNIVMMQERGDFSIYDAITATKKMDTDVLLVGEVNEPKLAGAYIQVAQSGSRMAITTLHHESTEALIEYMRNALVSEFGISDVRIAEEQVAGVLNFDIHMVHDVSGRHYIEHITEVVPDTSGRRKSYSLHRVIEFDKSSNSYRAVGSLSDFSYKRMRTMLGGDITAILTARLKAISVLEESRCFTRSETVC